MGSRLRGNDEEVVQSKRYWVEQANNKRASMGAPVDGNQSAVALP
jgi:hypothetical protein